MLELNDLVESREDDLMFPDDAASAHCRDSDVYKRQVGAVCGYLAEVDLRVEIGGERITVVSTVAV